MVTRVLSFVMLVVGAGIGAMGAGVVYLGDHPNDGPFMLGLGAMVGTAGWLLRKR